MSAFLRDQLDFIFFFYGMAFVLLGATCWAAARAQDRGTAWATLGAFAFVHGVGEWLDLTALIVGEAPAFALLRVALMTGSFVLLLDFARKDATGRGFELPGRWVYVLPALLVALVGVHEGVVAAGIAARYSIGFASALGTSLAFAWRARASAGAGKVFAVSASCGFALYAIAAGLIVPPGPFWPSTIVNHDAFSMLTGVPVQLVRGLLACWISLSIWAIWGRLQAADVASSRYTAYVRQQFVWTLVAMAAILVSGWMLTEHLGIIYRENVQRQARTDIDLLASRLSTDTAAVEGMVKALANSPAMMPLLRGAGDADRQAGLAVLNLDVEASGAKAGYLLDSSGVIAASSDRRETLGRARGFASTQPDGQFLVDARSGAPAYQVSSPVKAADGRIVGVAVLIKPLDGLETELRQFDHPYFLVDPDGVVAMTNRPGTLHRALWPANGAHGALGARLETASGKPMMEHGIVDAAWTNVDGEHDYVRRRFTNHSDWSLVIMMPSREIFATRFMGIIITLLVTMMALVYLLAKGRAIRDDIQVDNLLQLQELARSLGVKATTDPLTGLHNRLKLGSTLIDEMQRADRYNTPLSLVLFDIDHFKKINDTYGHLAGDLVLVQLARLLPNLIRSTDLLARWGGEEFLVLAPGANAPMAFQAAEKLRETIGDAVFDEVGSITCSFGVTQYTEGETAAQFIARADAALYRAKSEGRDRVTLAPRSGAETHGLASVA